MQIQRIKLKDLAPNVGQIPGLPVNPRQWSKGDIDRLAKSLRETPELFEARPIIAVPGPDGKLVILGGNMRYEACRANKAADAPCIVLPAGTPVDKLKEIVIKDNGTFGEWDMDALANEWSDLDLGEWGVPLSSDWLNQGDMSVPGPGEGPIRGAENLPKELQGLDIKPADLPKIQGSDQTAMDRVIIVYPRDRVADMAALLGLPSVDKVVYNIDEFDKPQ